MSLKLTEDGLLIKVRTPGLYEPGAAIDQAIVKQEQIRKRLWREFKS